MKPRIEIILPCVYVHPNVTTEKVRCLDPCWGGKTSLGPIVTRITNLDEWQES